MIRYTNNVTAAQFGRVTRIKTEFRPSDEAIAALSAAGMKYGKYTGWERACSTQAEAAACSEAIRLAGGVMILTPERSPEEWKAGIATLGWTGPVAWQVQLNATRYTNGKSIIVADNVNELYAEVQRIWKLETERSA